MGLVCHSMQQSFRAQQTKKVRERERESERALCTTESEQEAKVELQSHTKER